MNHSSLLCKKIICFIIKPKRKNLPWSFFSVSQNFCNSVKYLSSMNTFERPSVAMALREQQLYPAKQRGCVCYSIRRRKQHKLIPDRIYEFLFNPNYAWKCIMRWRRHRKCLKKRTHRTRCTRRNRTKLVRASVFFSSSFLLDTHGSQCDRSVFLCRHWEWKNNEIIHKQSLIKNSHTHIHCTNTH